MVTQTKGRSSLTRKLLRDLRSGWKSFLSILIICTLAITLYVGIDATWRAVEMDLEAQFQHSNMADIWVYGELSDRTTRDIMAIPGVTDAQRRLMVTAQADDLQGEPTMPLFMSEGHTRINKPLMRGGSAFTPDLKNQCILQQRFATAHSLKPGDALRLTIGDKVLSLTVCGIGNLPEYVVTSDGSEFSPSPLRYGYAVLSPGTLSDLPYSQIVLTIEKGADLANIKRQIQELTRDQQAVVTERKDIFGVKMAMEEAQQVRAMGAIFPTVFFVIAALITWTTMGRLVENQRLQIGTLFSTGYGRGELTWHFASYGLLVAVLGIVSGVLLARLGFAPILMGFMTSLYVLPDASPYVSPMVLLFISLLLFAITGGASVLSAAHALSQTPAALLRPKAPGKGKRVFLENVKVLWARIPFSEKMILRNLLRNPVRLLMGLIAAIGCTAMMLAGFGMRDSVSNVLVNHYTQNMRYDARITLEHDVPGEYGKSVALRAGASDHEEQMTTGVDTLIHGEWRSRLVHVLPDDCAMVWLTDERGLPVALPMEGAMLTEKASEDYGIGLGDTLWMRNPGERAVGVPIVGIAQLRLDQGVYFSRTAWDRMDLQPFAPTDVLLRGQALDLEAVKAMDGVNKARTIQEERTKNGSMLKIMDVIVLLLVLFSGALALVVFYNLGQLNFSERIRELATLKVLGFTPGEIKKLVLRENILITLMGLPFGLLAGPQLLYVLLTYGLPNTVQFVPYLTMPSWLCTAAFTLLFALMVNWMLGSKFKEVNMVEALKSVE